MKKLTFRKDIAGLRAIAVLMVIVYHIGEFARNGSNLFSHNNFNTIEFDFLKSFTGGFLGVDVFFVISGFLMTSIIFNRCLNREVSGFKKSIFSIFDFYKQRAKRICPALIPPIIIFIAILFLLSEANIFIKSVREGRYVLTFLSNYHYAHDFGYFDVDALQKLFLHTWSLSVEWQFYIIYPIILVILHHYLDIDKIKKVILFATIFFFILNIIISLNDKSYFFLHVRAYELLCGALVCVYPLDNLKDKKFFNIDVQKILQYLGILLILLSAFLVESKAIWSVFIPFTAVVGSMLVLYGNTQNILLDNKVSQFLGNISYSLYIYHWPVIVIAMMVGLFNVYIVLAIIFILSIASYYLVEKSRRFKTIFVLYILCYVTLNYLYKINNMKCDLSADTQSIMYKFCAAHSIPYQDKEGDEILLIGDSHIGQHINYLSNYFKLKTNSVSGTLYINDFLVYKGLDEKTKELPHTRYLALKELKDNSLVVVSFYYDSYYKELKACDSEYNCFFKGQKLEGNKQDSFEEMLTYSVDKFVEDNKRLKFLFLGDLFNFSNSVKIKYTGVNVFDFNLLKESKIERSNEGNLIADKVLKNIAQKYDNVYYLDLKDAFCNEIECSVNTENGVSIIYDKDHLSLDGVRYTNKLIVKTIDEILKEK